MDRMYLEVKNFARFQHYKDRSPPWIKLYSALLEDYDFLALSEAAQIQLLMIWLLAGRIDNRIPDDRRWIAQAIHAKSPLRLDELKRAGYLVPASTESPDPGPDASKDASKDASARLAQRYQDATAPRARGEAEAETETETTPRPLRARGGIRSELPERYHGDLDKLLLHVAVHETLYATLEALNSGEITPPAFSWDEIGLGLHDLVANGKHEHFNARQLRRYVQGAREQMRPGESGNGAPRKLTIGEQTFINAGGLK